MSNISLLYIYRIGKGGGKYIENIYFQCIQQMYSLESVHKVSKQMLNKFRFLFATNKPNNWLVFFLQ